MTVSDCVSVMLLFMFDSVADTDPVIDCSTVPVKVKILKASNVFDSERVSVTVWENVVVREPDSESVNVFSNVFEGVSDFPFVGLSDRVLWTVRVSESVCVYVVVRASDCDSVNDRSGVFEGVSDFPSVGLSDCVFWSV